MDVYSVLQFPLGLGSLFVGGGSGPTYTCARRELFSLITHSSIIASMGAWNGLVRLGG